MKNQDLRRMKRMIIYENKLSTQDFCALQEAVGFGRSNLTQTELAFKNRPNDSQGNGMMLNINK